MTDSGILANAEIVLPDRVMRGAVAFEKGVIAGITEGGHVPAGAMDCAGDLVMPGLIEVHTDNLERHLEPRPGVHFPPDQAVLAHDAELVSVGITTVFDAVRVGSMRGNAPGALRAYARGLVDQILALRRAGALKVSHHIHLRAEMCSETLIEELQDFGDQDQVGILSLMDHTLGQRQFRDMENLAEYIRDRFATAAEFEAHVVGQKALQARLGPAHEAAALAAAARFGAVLASHDDTTTAHVAQSVRNGVALAEFPTTEAAAQACKAAGIATIMGAPNLIRGGSHTGNVSAQALAERGCLDILSSDYVPATLLRGGFALGDLWGDTARGLATVTAGPATGAGLHDRGRIAAGLRADLLRVRRYGQGAVVRAVYVAGARVG